MVPVFLLKLLNLQSIVQGEIQARNKKKQDKEADKTDKKFQQDTQGLDSDNDKDTLGSDNDEIGLDL